MQASFTLSNARLFTCEWEGGGGGGGQQHPHAFEV